MSNLRSKRQGLERTIVTQFVTTIADLQLRKRAQQGSIAKRVVQGRAASSGDVVVGPGEGQQFVIDGIETAVIINSYQPIRLRIKYKSGELANVPCHGVFIFYGELERIEISAPEMVRLSFTYS